MRRNGRKEVTLTCFDGISADGGFVFDSCVLFPSLNKEWEKPMRFNVPSYSNGVMEVSIDYTESIPRVAELISGLFSTESTFTNLDSVILNYRNIRLRIGKDTGRKNIICMLMKAMSTSDYKNSNNEISVDTQICQKRDPLRNSDKLNILYEVSNNSFNFDEIFKYSKELQFRNDRTGDSIVITSLKDGIITINPLPGNSIIDFVKLLRNFFVPYSNFYGIKAIEVEFNQFSIRVDDQNVDRILYLYEKSSDMSYELREKEWHEYYNSPEYIRLHAKFLKKENRKKAVLQKIRQFKKSNADFTIAPNQHEAWENCKAINAKDGYSKCVIDYAILWAQYMEYLMAKHNKKLSEVWDSSSHSADIYGITGFMYGCAISILSSFWKYGEELRIQHNAQYHHKGNGVVNPAVLTISA